MDVSLDIIGDGSNRSRFEALVTEDLSRRIRFRGWLPRTAIGPILMQAHFILLPSDSSEGWPKVLSEGMAYGVVPVASDVSSIPHYLRESGVGVTCNAYDIDGFAAAIIDYARHPERWRIESIRGLTAAKRFTYEVYLENVSRLLGLADREPREIFNS
jgi:glycosyltransferase involved in cell wall biosynthesis